MTTVLGSWYQADPYENKGPRKSFKIKGYIDKLYKKIYFFFNFKFNVVQRFRFTPLENERTKFFLPRLPFTFLLILFMQRAVDLIASEDDDVS